MTAGQIGTIARAFNTKYTVLVVCVGIFIWWSFVRLVVSLCILAQQPLFWQFFANKATTAWQHCMIATTFYNPKDTVIVVLRGSFVLVEFCDVAFVIVPSFVSVGFFGISLPIKIRQPRNLVQ
jgi:hypothetical protein